MGGAAAAMVRVWRDDQYYPMAYSSFWLEYQAWGYWATGSHLVNVLLHALNAWLLWKALRMLEVPGAWLAAFIFALHPVEVESVAWITERKNVLSMTFYLLSALAWFRFQATPGQAGRGMKTGLDWRFYALAVLLFLCALWSKTVTCSLPAALLLVLWWKKERLSWRDVLPLAPLFAIGAGMGLMTGWMEKHVIGAKGNDWSLTLAQRFLIAGRAPWFYAGQIDLAGAADVLLSALAFGRRGMVAMAVPGGRGGAWRPCSGWHGDGSGKRRSQWRRFSSSRSSRRLGSLTFYPFRYSFVADHFQYLASIGPIALGAAGITWAFRCLDAGSRRLPPVALCGLLLLALGALTWRQGWMYSDLETFYRTIIARNPGCWMAYDNLAFDRLGHGRTDESMVLSRQALDIKPDDPEAHVNLGNAMTVKGKVDEAETLYRQALAIRPDFAEAHSDLGNVLLYKGKIDEAMDQYRQALAIRPAYAEAHNNLGFAFLKEKRLDEAMAEFRKALELQPHYPQAQANLDDAIAQKQRLATHGAPQG